MNMQQKKIQNPETQVPKTPQMSDRDFINDILATEKYLTTSYTHAQNEASHENLFRDIHSIQMETQKCQRNLFNVMFEKGWYSFEAADAQTLSETYQQFLGYRTQFPYS